MSDFPLNFTADSLVAEARALTGGLEDFGSGSFVEPLGIFVDSLRDDAMLNPTGVHIAKNVAMGHVVNRLNYVNDRKIYPRIAEQKIVKPVFIIGFPRTGTTILHDILAQDPANRAPLTWEVMFPSPPPQTATFENDPRIAACETSFTAVRAAIPQFKAMHPMGAQLSQECVTLMGGRDVHAALPQPVPGHHLSGLGRLQGRLCAGLRLPSQATAAPCNPVTCGIAGC